MTKVKERTEVLSQKALCDGIFDLRLKAPQIAAAAVPGQFVNVYLNDAARLLPRPISICGADASSGELRLVYRVTAKGAGTELLSAAKAGDALAVLGPLGNGFPADLPDCCVIGGGIGVPPLLELLKRLPGKKSAVLGYRNDRMMFLKDEFDAAADRVITATEDGSFGTKGTVIDALEESGYVPAAILSCGPKPMLAALKRYAAERNIPLWVSMEERMACGVGACLGCVTPSTETDSHSNVKNKRVCKDGPVFRAEEVVL